MAYQGYCGRRFDSACLYANLFKKIQLSLDPDFNEDICFEIINSQVKSINDLFDYLETKDVSLLSKKDTVIVENLTPTIIDLGSISSQFWDGIIYDNDSIIYNTQGIRSLSYLLDEFQCLNRARLTGEEYDFDMQNVPYAKARTKRILKRRFDYTDDQYDDFADQILQSKSDFIKNYFS